MALFTEHHAENIIYFYMHMKFLPKTELFLILKIADRPELTILGHIFN